MRLLLALLLSASGAWALEADNVAEQARNVAGLAAAPLIFKAAAWQTCSSDKPRIVIYGHSIVNGLHPQTLAARDAYRPAMLFRLAEHGVYANFVGTLTAAPAGGSLLCSPKTEGVSGFSIQQSYARMQATLATDMPNATSKDWVLIGPATNFNFTTLQETTDTFKACITFTAATCPAANIGICPDLPRYDAYAATIASYIPAIEAAYTWGVAQGYNVKWIDTRSCLTEPDFLEDKAHVSDAGNERLGACWADLIFNASGN